jgi:L-ectoine synthase
MIVTSRHEIDSSREVRCPHGGFISFRLLLARDEMGFSLHETVVLPGAPQHWHYKHHMEACYCLEGFGRLTVPDGRSWTIGPGSLYALNEHDEHTFEALHKCRVVLLCVFCPPVVGGEVHQPDGSYEVAKNV